MHDGRQVHMHDQRQIHNPSSSSADPNPPMMAIEPAASPEVVPSKLTQSRKKAPKNEAGLAQARLVANLIDGYQPVRAAHRAQQQADRRLPIEDQAAVAAPRGRTPSRAQSSNLRDDKTPEYRAKGRAIGNDGGQQAWPFFDSNSCTGKGCDPRIPP